MTGTEVGTTAEGEATGRVSDGLAPWLYRWPREELAGSGWRSTGDGFRVRELPETAAALEADSRWPALFPSPLCLVTAAGPDGEVGLEKVVGATIVNRFPYTLALSFCVRPLSARHHPRGRFLDLLERGGGATVQFIAPGPALDRAMAAIGTIPEERTGERLAAAGLATRSGRTGTAPVLEDAYLVYEGRLVPPGRDMFGAPIFDSPFHDVGSHRLAFLEIRSIQLDRAIAEGRRRIRWLSLPGWRPARAPVDAGPGHPENRAAVLGDLAYRKSYAADYRFPTRGTTSFEADAVIGDMAIRDLPATAEAQVEVDNDRARWPCFFPSSVGMITTWEDGPDGARRANVMPCGSTTVVSRDPLVVAPCISYAPINQRYAPRASLDRIEAAGRFGCGVPRRAPGIEAAIGYLGNVSVRGDPDKTANAGMTALPLGASPVLAELPVHFDCRLIGRVRMGTHVMLLGEVERIYARDDVGPDAPLEWIPWADVETVAGTTGRSEA